MHIWRVTGNGQVSKRGLPTETAGFLLLNQTLVTCFGLTNEGEPLGRYRIRCGIHLSWRGRDSYGGRVSRADAAGDLDHETAPRGGGSAAQMRPEASTQKRSRNFMPNGFPT